MTALHAPNSKLALFAQERERLILWVPVMIGVGIAAYFALLFEPWAGWGICALLATLAASCLLRRGAAGILCSALALMALGFTAAQWNTWRVRMPILHENIAFRHMSGTIAQIEVQEHGKGRMVLFKPSIEGLELENTPPRIRVSMRKLDPGLRIGDAVEATVTLYPLLGPTAPGGFDFARYLYFEGLGAIGYTNASVSVTAQARKTAWGETLNQLRLGLAQDMLDKMGTDAGSVAAALTVGEQNAVPEHINEVMRDSGLYHILSISGIHLALASGIVFFAVRFLLCLYMPLALRIPVKKIAACVALLSAFFYLLVAGYPVPAQRSFIMVSFVFLAVLADRKGISIYALAWAATALLLWKPDSLLGASFQMSFAATLAIVSFYERYAKAVYKRAISAPGRFFMYFMAVMLTSLAATLATAPFVLFHFNRLQVWGLLSNMLVEPLVAFWIMPGVVVTFLLWPFGLQAWGYPVIGSGVKMMLACAEWVAQLPYASIAIASPGVAGLSLCVFGMLWIAIWRGRIHLLGWLFMALGLSCVLLARPPDVLIAGDAKAMMARLENGEYTLLKGTMRNFTVKNWLSMVGKTAAVPSKNADTLLGLQQKGITVILKEDQMQEACAQNPAAVIALFYLPPYECVEAALRIDAGELERQGAHALYFEKTGVKVESTADVRGKRPWVP